MRVLEVTQKVTDGKLIIDVPDYLNNQDVTITISSDSAKGWTKLSLNERLEILQAFAGSDRFPDYKPEDYDVYDQ